jgi:hypothetical protein
MYWIYIELLYVYIYFHQFLYGWMHVLIDCKGVGIHRDTNSINCLPKI